MTTAALKKKTKNSWAKMCSAYWNSDCDWGEFNTLTTLSVPFYEHGFSLRYLDLWFLSSMFYIFQYTSFVHTLLRVSLSISKTLMLL